MSDLFIAIIGLVFAVVVMRRLNVSVPDTAPDWFKKLFSENRTSGVATQMAANSQIRDLQLTIEAYEVRIATLERAVSELYTRP